MAEQYAQVAQQIEDVSAKLDKATDDLNKALEERAAAQKKFGELLRTPFGEPSAIDKAMRDGEATVDSIISMYDELVETVNQRFTGMSQGAKSLIVDYLNDQTDALVKLVKRRNAAVEALKEAEDDLKEVLETQAAFQTKLSSGIKDFAKALIDLSNTDSRAVISVTKTASGLVISQVRNATKGVDTITNQLKQRLTQVVEFGKNIEKLLASGLSREYIQQLLEAGPDAASETAALLTTASADQIAQINSLYTQINTQADKFGKDMSEVFYGNSVAMAQAFVKGAQAEVTNINNQMTAIVNGIKIIMGVCVLK
jgi:ABC-type transporter Mla subunit MlaD